jgi:hypothetical protein
MLNVGGIRIGALLIALFAFYVVPLLPLIVLTSMPNFFPSADTSRQLILPFALTAAWFLAIAPVGSGYLAAKLAGQLPLFHGLIAGLVGAALVALTWRSDFVSLAILFPVIVLASGLFGGWLWRYRNEARRVGL